MTGMLLFHRYNNGVHCNACQSVEETKNVSLQYFFGFDTECHDTVSKMLSLLQCMIAWKNQQTVR